MQCRTFEVDIRNKAIRNLSRAGNVHKKYLVSDIENFQRVVGLNDAVDLTFKNANHAYRLYFMKKQSISSVVMRERFYQLLSLLQCKEAAETEENRDMQEALDLGVESVRVFVTTFNLGGYYPPKNLGDWLPLHDNCDIYVIGVQVRIRDGPIPIPIQSANGMAWTTIGPGQDKALSLLLLVLDKTCMACR
jgi:hypothetical protein